MRRIAAPFLLSVGLLVLLGGCTTRQPLAGITFELVKLERGADGGISATLQVVNSAVYAFNIASSKHQLLLNGRLVGTIDLTEPTGLPPERTLTQTVPLKLAGGGLPAAGPATYQLNSTLTMVLYQDKKEEDKLTSSGTVQVP